MMNQTRSLLALSALLCLDYSMAFSVAPASSSLATTTSVRPTSTCLFADNNEGAEEAAPPQGAAPDDILNSPAFLKRKIDVLQSDIAKAEEGIELAKQRMEEGKAEWGGQLDELQKEVSDFVKILGVHTAMSYSRPSHFCVSLCIFVLDPHCQPRH